jgi:hypothetical protein
MPDAGASRKRQICRRRIHQPFCNPRRHRSPQVPLPDESRIVGDAPICCEITRQD